MRRWIVAGGLVVATLVAGPAAAVEGVWVMKETRKQVGKTNPGSSTQPGPSGAITSEFSAAYMSNCATTFVASASWSPMPQKLVPGQTLKVTCHIGQMKYLPPSAPPDTRRYDGSMQVRVSDTYRQSYLCEAMKAVKHDRPDLTEVSDTRSYLVPEPNHSWTTGTWAELIIIGSVQGGPSTNYQVQYVYGFEEKGKPGSPPSTTPPSAPTPQPPMQPPSGSPLGTWQTNFGTLQIAERGGEVVGTFTHKGGQISGGRLEGNLLRGTWTQTPTRRPPWDAGSFEFVFAPDGASFTGRYRYGFEGPIDHPWNGRR